MLTAVGLPFAVIRFFVRLDDDDLVVDTRPPDVSLDLELIDKQSVVSFVLFERPLHVQGDAGHPD
jgi:hypothetical protein